MQDVRLFDLIRQARRGDAAAFGELARLFRHYLLNVANKTLPRDISVKVAPSDLVQDTFMEAQRDLAAFRGAGEEEFRAWLRQILMHNIANAVRTFRATQKRNLAREAPLDPRSGSDPGLELPSRQEEPLGELINGEEERRLSEGLATLPQLYRQVIELRNRHRLSFADIGRRLDRSEEAARKLWARAIDQLGRALQETDEG